MAENTRFGKLWVVAAPIGEPTDITQRAVALLGDVDFVICEERKEGSKLLKQLAIQKPLIELNEHNEQQMLQDVIIELMNGKSMALVSDGGTPVFSDPGRALLQMAHEMNIPVSAAPGASSLMAAISLCPFDLRQFFFAGFLPPKTEERSCDLKRYQALPQPIILMDTPYRLAKLLGEVAEAYGAKQRVFLGADLTMRSETVLVGPIHEVATRMGNRKAEFILVIDKPERRRR